MEEVEASGPCRGGGWGSQHEHATVGDARAPGLCSGERDDDARCRCPWGSASFGTERRRGNGIAAQVTKRPGRLLFTVWIAWFPFIYLYIYIYKVL
jgi:hypothetical protein